MEKIQVKRHADFNKDERSLVLYCEARAVDYNARLNVKQLNDTDNAILKEWNESGYVLTGRIVMKDVTEEGSLWCWLSPEAFEDAAIERKQRSARFWKGRTYETTLEKQGDAAPKYEF
jgi:hypothetical protein